MDSRKFGGQCPPYEQDIARRAGTARRVGRSILVTGILLFCFAPLRTSNAQIPTTQPHKVDLPGTLEAFEQTDLCAKVAGYLSEVRVDIGDHVKAGDLLANIDVPELQNDLTEAISLHAARQKSLEAADAAIEQAKSALETAEKQLDRYKADLALQEATLKRQEQLYANKAATDQQLDEVRSKTEVARAEAAVAQAKIAGASADLKGAQASRAVAAAQVDVAAAAIEKARTFVGYTKIVAPFDGTVTRRLVNRGDLVQASMANRAAPLFTVQRLDIIRVFFDVPEADAALVQINDAATIKIYGSAVKPIEAKVTRFARALNPQSRTMRTEIDIPNPGEKLLPGTYAQITLQCSGPKP